jgi:hypothetical protein
VQRLHCENFKKAVGLRDQNKPVAIAKLNNPINASAAEANLLRNLLDVTIANSKGLRTKKSRLDQFT